MFMATHLIGFGAGEASKLIDFYAEANQSSEQDLRPTVDSHGQAITLAAAESIASVKWYIKKALGSPTGNAITRLYGVTGTVGTDGKPTGAALASSNTVDVTTLTTSLQLIEFTFASPYAASAGDICLALEYTAGDASNYISMGFDGSSPTHAGNWFTGTPGSWTGQSTIDQIFYLYRA